MERLQLHCCGLTARRPRILVVEDDAALAHLYCTAISLRGIACTRVGDGVSALRSLEQMRPDLVILDLNLPTVDGHVVLREFAQNPLTSDIPVIVVTGMDPTPVLPQAAMVLRKPCDPQHVARIAADHLAVR